MPDLLAHAFIAYTIGRLVSWHYDWYSLASTTAVMAGAFIPDLTKATLIVSSGTVEHLLGVPFNWGCSTLLVVHLLRPASALSLWPAENAPAS